MSLEIIEKQNKDKHNLSNSLNPAELPVRSHAKIFQFYMDRCIRGLEKLQLEKKICLQEWKLCCEQNFTKSLDHKSFFFKEAQKK